MPITTDLSVSPYFDDYNESTNYHQVLFKPGVALQTRELNVLQSMLQKQIERFGDNIFSKGTIISGCNFQYYTNYPYVKILDTQVDGSPVAIGNYVNLYAKSASSNLVSFILNANSGYVSQAPDLNTLFVRYINSGNSGTQTAYNSSDILTIYDANNSIFQTNVPVGGTGAGFSNSDSLVFMSALAVGNNSANSATIASAIFSALSTANTISDPVSGARAVITEVNTTAIANTLILKVRPYANDMANSSITTTNNWSFNTGNSVIISNSTGGSISTYVTVNNIIGAGATAIPVTDGTGKVIQVLMTAQGNGYIVAPYATIKTANNSAAITNLIADTGSSLTAQNYLCQVTVANTATSGSSPPVGLGYAFGVSQGIIYQKGYFLYVNPQIAIVSKYSQTPDQVFVGFNTAESLINSNIDQTLLDNATGTFNSQAPGADRLLLSPSLVVINATSASGNSAFFPITAFSLGQPYLQNQQTSYNVLGDAMAQRTYESAGNFVNDPFLLSTKTANLDSASNSSTQANTFNVIIDPGSGYISGYRVKTYSNFFLPVKQGTDTTSINSAMSITYGNFFNVQEIGGVFNYTTGDYVTLYDTAKQFLTNSTNYSTGNTLPAGNAIGTARIRSMIPQSGVPGTPSATSRLYLFDINMYPGKNLLNARSVYYSNTFSGIADIVLTNVPSIGANAAVVSNAASSQMIFNHGAISTQATSNINFQYKGLFHGASNVSINTGAGSISLQLGSHIFPFGNGAILSDSQLSQLSVVFHANNAQANTNTAVTFTTVASNNVVTTSSTTGFSVGDYLKIYSNTGGEVKRINNIINATALQMDSNLANSNTTANAVSFFPQHVPVPLNGRLLGDRTANISANGSLLTINLGKVLAPLSGPAANVTVMTPVTAVNQPTTGKTSRRDTTVIIHIANNSAGNSGPWPLGHTDAFRLKKVYKDVNTSILTTTANIANPQNVPSTWTDVTNQFYIDHKQHSDYYDLSYLYLKPKSTLSIGNGDALCVQFDHFTISGTAGIFTRSSYPVDDTKPYVNVSATGSTSIHTHEIPELVDDQGNYRDPIDHVDFRPRVANTARVTAGNNALSTVNPVDYGAVQTLVMTGTLNTNTTITGLSPNTSGIVVGTGVTANIAGIPANTTVASIVNSTAITISSAATSSGSATLVFNGDTVKFSSLTTQLFPIDGAMYTQSVTQYMGRVDRIIVDKTGNIKVLSGTPGTGTLSPPAEPPDSMTINLLFVPPYPSIPQQLDSNYTSIVDKGIGSQVYSVQRITNHSIAVPVIPDSQISILQPQAYSMKQIATLERRIAALEQYVSLSQLEQGINNLAIPSSINANINRFKYGFFADNFTTTNYTDINNPEYSATIIKNEVTAKQILNNIEFGFNTANVSTNSAINGLFLTLPYAQTVLLSQLSATNGAISNTTSQPVEVKDPPPVTQYHGKLVSNPPTFTLITKIDDDDLHSGRITSAGGSSVGLVFTGVGGLIGRIGNIYTQQK